MKLRNNNSFKGLAYRFNTRADTISMCFKKVIVLLEYAFRYVVHWPERDRLRAVVPDCFFNTFGNSVAVIIDCFEITSQRPSNVKAKAQTFSSYKHNYSVKYLIGITPQGLVSFVSEGYGGRASDKYITEDCKILDNFLPGDIILADRGFTVRELVSMQYAELKTLQFLRGQKQLHPKDIEKTRNIAKVRVHVERVIGNLRNKFKIMNGAVPINFSVYRYKDKILMDYIVRVCCILINLCDSVILLDKSRRPNENGILMTMLDNSPSQANIAQRNWEMTNNIEHISAADEIFKYDRRQQQDILCAKPWDKDPHFFKDIKISALALLKMVMHARSGGNLEVMGLLLGKVDGNTMIVMETFALPVEGTETRVNAQAQAYEYMTAYIESAKQVGRLENAIGWYHSHPGYGCWLSGIDVATQMLNQNFQEPFVAIVIDPVRTISAGRVCIGAFRTYPKGYKPPNEEPSEYQTIPLNKIEDFGVHCKQYYSLDITYFKSSLDRKLLDSLWNKYWVNTLSSSSLITNDDYLTGQIYDLSEKLEQSESQVGRYVLGDLHEKRTENKLSKATKDSNKTTIEILHGLMAQTIKDKLFNNVALRTDAATLVP